MEQSTMTPEEVQAQQNQAQAAEREQIARSEAAGEEPAARTDPNTDPFGMSLGRNADGTVRNEIAGGAIVEEHLAPPVVDTALQREYFHLRYVGSRLAREAGHLIARSPENIGFWGKGMTYRGNGGILVNIDTLEKHRFQDGYVFEGDDVWANSRDLPPALVTGDVSKNLSGDSARQMMDDYQRRMDEARVGR